MSKVWRSNMNYNFSRDTIGMMNSVHPAFVMCKYCKHKDTCPKLKSDIHTTETSHCNNWTKGDNVK